VAFLVRLVVKRNHSGYRAQSGRLARDVDAAVIAFQGRAGTMIGHYREASRNGDAAYFYLLLAGGVGGHLGFRCAGSTIDDVAEGERAAELERWLLGIRP
jgi:hypothetical protein